MSVAETAQCTLSNFRKWCTETGVEGLRTGALLALIFEHESLVSMPIAELSLAELPFAEPALRSPVTSHLDLEAGTGASFRLSAKL